MMVGLDSALSKKTLIEQVEQLVEVSCNTIIRRELFHGNFLLESQERIQYNRCTRSFGVWYEALCLLLWTAVRQGAFFMR